MSYESKLARSIQSDHHRDAAIEREYDSSASVKGTLVKFVATIAVMVVLADLFMTVAAG